MYHLPRFANVDILFIFRFRKEVRLTRSPSNMLSTLQTALPPGDPIETLFMVAMVGLAEYAY